jgi:hypothetical protein
MSLRRTPPLRRDGDQASFPATELLDEMLSRYIDWREHAAAVRNAYEHWSAAEVGDRAWRFVAYRAALDLEEWSAGRYAVAVAGVERSLHRGRTV